MAQQRGLHKNLEGKKGDNLDMITELVVAKVYATQYTKRSNSRIVVLFLELCVEQ